MEYRSIAEIYDVNDAIRRKLVAVVGDLSAEQADALPDGEKWSISQIVEHISMVSGGIFRICGKLLSKAEANGSAATGIIDVETLHSKVAEIENIKLEAPEMVRPSDGKPISESLAVLESVSAGMRSLQEKFESFDGNSTKFPHPYFGDLSAIEWLSLAGGHEARHTRQIKRILEKLPS